MPCDDGPLLGGSRFRCECSHEIGQQQASLSGLSVQIGLIDIQELKIALRGARETEKNESVDWKMSYANARGAGSPSHYSSCHIKTPLNINCRLNAIES